MFEIETGFAIPEQTKRGGKRKYPWYELEVGQSFFVPDAYSSFSALVRAQTTRMAPRKFEHRWVDGGVRVWRTA